MKKKVIKSLMKAGLLGATVISTGLHAQEEVIKPNVGVPPIEAQEAQKVERDDAAKRYYIQQDYQFTVAKTKTTDAMKLYTENKYEEAIKLFSESEEIIRTKIIQDNPRPSVKVLELSATNRKMLSECYRNWAHALIKDVDSLGENPDPKACQKAIDCLIQAKEVYSECAPIVNERIIRYEKILKGQEFDAALTNEGIYGGKEGLAEAKDRQLKIEIYMRRGQAMYVQKQYESARENFQNVLRLDPTNIDAAHWMAKVNTVFLDVAREHWITNRAADMVDVLGGEFQPIPPRESIQQNEVVELGEKRVSPTEKKLNDIYIKKIEFKSYPLKDVIYSLRQESIERDNEGLGVNFVYKVEKPAAEASSEDTEGAAEEGTTDESATTEADPAEASESESEELTNEVKPEDRPIDLTVKDMVLKDVLDEVIKSYPDLRYRIDKNAVVVYSSLAKTGELQTEIFPAEEEGDNEESLPSDEEALRGFFEGKGVLFPKGSIIKFDPRERQLFARNTPDQLELIREVLNERAVPVRMINIAARFIEIAQNDLQELGVDWILTRVPPAGASKSSIPFRFGTTSETPIQPYMGATESTTLADGTSSIVTEAQPNALRSVGRNGIGSEVPPETISDKAFSWRHTADRRVSDPLDPNVPNKWGNDWSKGTDVEVIIRALSQSSTADVLAMPSITTCDDEMAEIHMVTKVFYPKEWSKPQYQEVVNNNDNNNNNTGIGNNNTNLTAFIGSIPSLTEPTDIGISLMVTPRIDKVEPIIFLKALQPKVTSFVGWRDYSFSFDLNKNGTIEEAEVQTMIMPRIEKRTVETDVYVGNGQTLMLGGSLKDKTYSRVDKIPILGDLPLVGRAFQTQAKRVESTNLLIFVTARIVNTDGTPAIVKGPQDLDGTGTIDMDK